MLKIPVLVTLGVLTPHRAAGDTWAHVSKAQCPPVLSTSSVKRDGRFTLPVFGFSSQRAWQG